MKRKHFLSSLAAIGAMIPFEAGAHERNGPAKQVVPPYLKKGDTIGICSPAGYITLEDIQPSIEQIKTWGLKVKIGNTIGKRNFGFGGTDIERLNDLQQMLDD